MQILVKGLSFSPFHSEGSDVIIESGCASPACTLMEAQHGWKHHLARIDEEDRPYVSDC